MQIGRIFTLPRQRWKLFKSVKEVNLIIWQIRIRKTNFRTMRKKYQLMVTNSMIRGLQQMLTKMTFGLGESNCSTKGWLRVKRGIWKKVRRKYWEITSLRQRVQKGRWSPKHPSKFCTLSKIEKALWSWQITNCFSYIKWMRWRSQTLVQKVPSFSLNGKFPSTNHFTKRLICRPFAKSKNAFSSLKRLLWRYSLWTIRNFCLTSLTMKQGSILRAK